MTDENLSVNAENTGIPGVFIWSKECAQPYDYITVAFL
jgi:hypothetical protein